MVADQIVVRGSRPARAGSRRRPAALRRLARPSPLAPAALRALRAAAARRLRAARRRTARPASAWATATPSATARTCPRARRRPCTGADAAWSRPSSSASGKGSPSATATTTRANLEGQYLPLTGLADGRYVLVHRVNARPPDPGDGCRNNAASVLLALSGGSAIPYVRVLARCPDSAHLRLSPRSRDREAVLPGRGRRGPSAVGRSRPLSQPISQEVLWPTRYPSVSPWCSSRALRRPLWRLRRRSRPRARAHRRRARRSRPD